MAYWPKNDRSLRELTPKHHADRTRECMEWMAQFKQPATIFPRYGAMTVREVNVAIGWDNWPEDWPLT